MNRRARNWIALRRKVLAASPVCSVCEVRSAAEVDHLVPLGKGGDNSLGNLRAVCRDCHRRKTRTDWAPTKTVTPDGREVPGVLERKRDLMRRRKRARMRER